jgi:histidinol-phosphate phosphatase family protein
LETGSSNLSLLRPKQAVILAGGRGERLRPFTDIRPKPMILIHGKPFLEYLLTMLRAQGFERIVLLLGYLPDVVQEYFGDGSRWGMEITYSITPIEDETGLRIKKAEHLLEECFLLLYCDNYWPMQMDKMWQRFVTTAAPAMLTIYSNKDNYTKDSLRVDDRGFVCVYDKKRKTSDLKGVEISYGIFKKALLSLLPEGNISFEETLYPVLAKENKLAAFVTDHRYYSVGSLQRLPLTESFLARYPTIILDRDGVLNRKPSRANYVRSWQEFEWLPGSKEALALLQQTGFRTLVVSNQAGVARGAMSEGDLLEIHRRMVREATMAGGSIEAIYYCPHGWDEGCECRKPKPGMLFQAQRDFNLDLSRTLFIGDDERDAQAADAAGCPSLLVSEEKTLLQAVQQLTKKQNIT